MLKSKRKYSLIVSFFFQFFNEIFQEMQTLLFTSSVFTRLLKKTFTWFQQIFGFTDLVHAKNLLNPFYEAEIQLNSTSNPTFFFVGVYQKWTTELQRQFYETFSVIKEKGPIKENSMARNRNGFLVFLKNGKSEN
jgi:hypothetical protein